MERIQQAIDKARRERQGAIGNQQTASAGPLKPAALERVGAAAKGAISVTYSRTRRITFSEDELKARRIVAGLAHDRRSEPYRQLRSQILKKMRDENWRTLAVTSPTGRNGKTLTAINLAISLSQEVNQTVMLVDLDLRAPGIATSLGVDDIDKGIVDNIVKHTPLEDILINPGYERLVILPGTPQGPYTSEILSSPEMRQLQSELYHRYEDRLIIYDLPALLTSDDALVFTPNVDATLLVIEDGGSSKDELERAITLLQGTRLIGTVINKLR